VGTYFETWQLLELISFHDADFFTSNPSEHACYRSPSNYRLVVLLVPYQRD